MPANSGTGFSREEASADTLIFAVWHLTPSRLKPVPQGVRTPFRRLCMPANSGAGFSREGASAYTLTCVV